MTPEDRRIRFTIMPYHDRTDLDALKAQTDLVAYLEHAGVDLVRVGNRYRGHCPLHADATPSFFVDPEENHFHCFGCQQGGDIFTLTQKLYDLPFPEAVERIIEYNGDTVPTKSPVRAVSQKNSQLSGLETYDHALLERVADHYRKKLEGYEDACEYLASRGIRSRAINDFSVGYATGFLEQELDGYHHRLRPLGLVSSRGHDTFYRRVTVPIRNLEGKVCQLYGRSLTNQFKHRYLSVPHTTLFHPEALQERSIILCESVLDALTLYGIGFDNATSVYGAGGLKQRFIEQMKASGVKRTVIAYDADEAGNRGAMRAADSLKKVGIKPYRLPLPPDEDVNSLSVLETNPERIFSHLFQQSLREGM